MGGGTSVALAAGMKTRFLPALLLTVFACASQAPTSPVGDGDGDGDGGTSALQIAGDYDVVANWDLRSAFAADRLGDSLAALLVEQIAESLPVPGLLEGKARDAVEAAIGDTLASFIAEHAPQSDFVLEVGSVLATTELASTFTFDESGAGREHLRSIAITASETHRVTLPGELVVAGDFNGARTNDNVTVSDHALELRLDEMLLPILADVFGDGSLEELHALAGSVLSCDALAQSVVGESGLTIGVGGLDYTISASDVSGLCSDASAAVGEKVLELLPTETGFAASGGIVFGDADRDGVADELASDETYAGTFTTPSLPLVLNVDVSLVGRRR